MNFIVSSNLQKQLNVTFGKFSLFGIGLYGFSVILSRLFQATSFIFLARNLSNEEMGQVAILAVIYIGVSQVGSLGFEQFLIRSSTTSEQDLTGLANATWGLQLFRAIVIVFLSITIFTLSRPYLTVEISWLAMAITCCGAAFLGLVNPWLAMQERKGSFSVVSSVNAGAVFLGSTVTLILIAVHPSLWAYVCGQVMRSFAAVSLSFLLVKRLPRPAINPKVFKQIWGYSRHILVIAIVSFVATQSQIFYVGEMFGAAILGIFYTWQRFTNLPTEVLTQIQNRIMFAKVSEHVRQDIFLEKIHLIVLGLSTIILSPFFILLFWHGDQIVANVINAELSNSWWIGKWCVLNASLFALCGTLSPFCLVLAPKFIANARLIEASIGLSMLIILGHQYELAGVLAAMTIELAIAISARLYLSYSTIFKVRQLSHFVGSAVIVLTSFIPGLVVDIFLYPHVTFVAFLVYFLLAYGLYGCVLTLIGYIWLPKLKKRNLFHESNLCSTRVS